MSNLKKSLDYGKKMGEASRKMRSAETETEREQAFEEYYEAYSTRSKLLGYEPAPKDEMRLVNGLK